MNISLRYDQSSASLQIEGLPDTSLGQPDGVVGIVSSWKLQLMGSIDLEGKREHLEDLMANVLPYARYLMSDVSRTFGDSRSSVSISPEGSKHRLLLKSSRPDVQPLTIDIDDAELADLVRCLDDLRLDNRVKISWKTPLDQPLTRNELVHRIPFMQRIFPPLIGGASIFLVAFSALFVTSQLPTEENRIDQTPNPIELNKK